jgi:hypothetical protein
VRRRLERNETKPVPLHKVQRRRGCSDTRATQGRRRGGEVSGPAGPEVGEWVKWPGAVSQAGKATRAKFKERKYQLKIGF